MGRVIELIDCSDFEKRINKVQRYMEEEERQAENLANSLSFKMVWYARKYDEWFLDPIVGFMIPGLGDIISGAAILPSLYVSIFRLHSITLTLAILWIAILDVLAGLIPVVGDCVDAFYKSNKRASRWIVGYVEDDEDTKSEIRKNAIWGTLSMAAIGMIMYLCYELIITFYHWIVNLF